MRLPPVTLLCLSLAAGCAPPPRAEVPSPMARVRSFADAIEADDPTAALALLRPADRSAAADARFRALWAEHHAELRDLSRQLRDRALRAHATAHVTLASGEQVALELQEGRWRLSGGVLDAQSQRTPLDAVSALRRALMRGDLPGLLRLLSRERRAAFAASFERAVRQTEDPLDLELEVTGDQAVVSAPGGGEILLRREAGRWFVEEVR